MKHAPLLASLLLAGAAWAQPAARGAAPLETRPIPLETPPGFNVHLVFDHKDKGLFWRGGGPRPDTMQFLAEEARRRHRPLTLIDLRHPANRDDVSGKGGRLSPAGEEKMASSLGLRYHSISALDEGAVAYIAGALKEGDVYVHCMYGVNRTGFMVGRYATSKRLEVDRTGMGTRDYRDGVKFQERVQH